MARTLSSQAVFHSLTGVFRLDTTATTGAVDTGGGASKGAITAISLGAGEGASFSAGDRIMIGSGSTAEVNEIATVATDDVTPKLPWSRDIAVGETVTLLTAVDLGATDENGVSLETTQGETAIVAGTQKKTYLYINQNIEEQMTFALRDFDAENIAAAFGMSDSASGVVGTNGVVLVLDDAVTETYQPWCFEGLLEGGTAVTAFIFSAKVASVNTTMAFAEGQATVIPFTLKSNGNRSFLLE
jgi:hypothetical protein